MHILNIVKKLDNNFKMYFILHFIMLFMQWQFTKSHSFKPYRIDKLFLEKKLIYFAVKRFYCSFKVCMTFFVNSNNMDENKQKCNPLFVFISEYFSTLLRLLSPPLLFQTEELFSNVQTTEPWLLYFKNWKRLRI